MSTTQKVEEQMKVEIRQEREHAFQDRETALAFLRSLLNRSGISKHMFFESLAEMEPKRELWVFYGVTFLDYLRASKLRYRTRFEPWKTGREILGADLSEMLGADATYLIARIEAVEDQRAAITEMLGRHRANGGIVLSHQSAKRIVDCYVNTPPKRLLKEKGEPPSRMATENERLRAEVEELKAENEHLRKELSGLRASIRDVVGGSSEQPGDETAPSV